jgi:hypothetical protein
LRRAMVRRSSRPPVNVGGVVRVFTCSCWRRGRTWSSSGFAPTSGVRSTSP